MMTLRPTNRGMGFAALLLSLVSFAHANTGDLFRITSTGPEDTLSIQLCLNVQTPWSCENHTVTRQNLDIQTVTPHHTYPAAGIRVLTPGHTMTGCTLLGNGYCQFSVNDTSARHIELPSAAGPNLTGINIPNGPLAGGTGVVLTGTNLAGATAIKFGEANATFVHVVDNTTVTAVTPSQDGPGVVAVVITTPTGSATLPGGYTYEANAPGQPSGGGKIACLEGENNLIAATVDNNGAIQWGGSGTAIGADAQSIIDGAANTTAIVDTLGKDDNYAAKLCRDYQVDSQGNSPCVAGNECYNDWFLPAGNNTEDTGQLNCLFVNKDAIGEFTDNPYWSSTESSNNPQFCAWSQGFNGGVQSSVEKGSDLRVRCVRAFNP